MSKITNPLEVRQITELTRAQKNTLILEHNKWVCQGYGRKCLPPDAKGGLDLRVPPDYFTDPTALSAVWKDLTYNEQAVYGHWLSVRLFGGSSIRNLGEHDISRVANASNEERIDAYLLATGLARVTIVEEDERLGRLSLAWGSAPDAQPTPAERPTPITDNASAMIVVGKRYLSAEICAGLERQLAEAREQLSEVIEMGLCEVPRIMLRPNQLYRFMAMPDCKKCEDAAAPYQTES